jgi:hypothetical protein
MGPPDPIFGLTDAFNKVCPWISAQLLKCVPSDACPHSAAPRFIPVHQDTSPKKVSLGVGAYRDDKGKVRPEALSIH